MVRKRVKTDTANEDRISALPDPVIHHILSFVPTVFAVRMSILSRRWRRVWHSVPTLLFPFRDGFQSVGPFNKFVEICLKHRKRATRFVAGSSVTSFKLETHYSQEDFAALSMWLHPSFVVNNIKELDVCLRPSSYGDGKKNFSLPSSVLNGRSLTRLKLEGYVKISASCSVNLPSLKYLSLNRVKIGADVLHNLVIGCPILEEFVIKDIHYRENLRISSLSLKCLEVDIYSDLGPMEMKIEAVNLTSLVMVDYGSFYNFSALRAVKYVKLHNLGSNSLHRFEGAVSKLHELEDLTLQCDEYLVGESLTISNQNLKHFSVCGCWELRITMETPRLVSFNYCGDACLAMSLPRWSTGVIGQFSLLGPCYEREDKLA